MRIATVLVLVVIVVGIALATMVWVPKAGEVFIWNAGQGVLEIPEAGIKLRPRWSWSREQASTLGSAVAAASSEGIPVTVSVRWNPVSGAYRLAPAVSARSGFESSIGTAVSEVVGAVGLDCLTGTADAVSGNCDLDPRAAVGEEVADAVGASPERFRVSFEISSAARRELLLREVASSLPATGRKVLLLGLDGLDWDLVLPWIEAGRMPNLQRVMAAGTWGTMETIVPTLSPLIWTSIATGATPDRHGILDFVEKDPTRGVMVPVTGRNRQVPAMWNVASALARSAAVVGWWGSWPADRVNGLVVSDRLYYTLTQGLTKEVLREDPPEMVFPASRRDEFIDLRNRAVRETDWAAVRFFMDISEAEFDAAVAANKGMDDPVDGFRRLLAATRTYLGAGLLAAAEKPDLAMIYLEGTDTIGHLLAPYIPPPTFEVEPEVAARYAAAVPRYFEIVDRWLGRYFEEYPLARYTVILVSDHGFKWSGERPRGLSGTEGPTAALWHDQDAAFVVSGPGVEPLGRVSANASIYDVAPTIAALLGLPPDVRWGGEALPGTIGSGLEPIDYLALVPPASYRPDAGDAVPVDPEFISKLRALGYLGGGVDGAARSQSATDDLPTQAFDVTQPEADASTTTRGELNNLAILKTGEKKYDEAERLLRQAIAQSPDYPAPHYNLRRVYMETERYEDADRELWIAIDKGLRDPERTLDRAAADYENLGLEDRAIALLDEALERFPEHEPFWVHSMVAEIRSGECAKAHELGPEAVRRFPESAPVHAFYGLAAACVGDVPTARTEIERSLALNPNQDTLRRTLRDLPQPSGS